MLETLQHQITPILKRHDVDRAGIFGSFSRGEQSEDSDLDILIQFKGEKSLLDLAALKIELEETLGIKVDLVTYRALSPRIRDKVLKEQVVIL